MIECALFQPDIPQNTGAILRLGACLAVPVHVIRPTGFILSDQKMRRAGMDYIAMAALRQHDDWNAFDEWRRAHGRRLVALSTKAEQPLHDFAFRDGDIILMGRESAGLPDDVHAACDARLRIPMQSGARSLNVAISAGIALAEALRQTGLWPAATP
ncbi:tRNA (cytidine/uridine-2'-O-)-methyltransferase [Faunimonas pinastri]|uniref:tRNA (cytidine(34)-2'-O)-methyltransferase n=1 Tax=Faunimonas pinastri TaxID=1855383 RepID=A0A1H9AEB1_9HYPH|nr:tRNA (cytidine(34)-2'-O)-methyltransferase [Faunimonas pinastri]SEP75076.1 tRNA (cytidine/uridine-2'-O-)-methyltransferase [Faunimonas pinastri]